MIRYAGGLFFLRAPHDENDAVAIDIGGHAVDVGAPETAVDLALTVINVMRTIFTFFEFHMVS